MKLLATTTCLTCVLAFGQDEPAPQKMGPPGEMLRRGDTATQISRAIDQHKLFQLPENFLWPNVSATATGLKVDGNTLMLTSVEIMAGRSLVVIADEVVYDYNTHQIELRGNVRLKSLTPQ